MGFGRQTANYLERQAQATAARASDDFLSRLQQAEARDAADRPTGAEDPRHALPPRTHMEAAQKNAQLATHQPFSRAGMQQVILPKTAYDHSAAYREQPPPREAAYAKADVKSLYAPPGAHRQIVSRNMRRHYQPIASQVDLSQPTAEPMTCGGASTIRSTFRTTERTRTSAEAATRTTDRRVGERIWRARQTATGRRSTMRRCTTRGRWCERG